MKWFNHINEILNVESEIRLSYQAALKIVGDDCIDIKEAECKSILSHVVGFIVAPFRKHKVSFLSKKYTGSYKYVIFSSSINQSNSLVGFIKSLKCKNKKFVSLAPKKIINNIKRFELFEPVVLSFSDVVKGYLIACVRVVSLYSALPKKCRSYILRSHLASFLYVYIYIPYFYRLLKDVKPSYVVVSNDHNVPTRSLIAVANYLGVKTVYMQHASVSNIFPALRFTYAFLDGVKSLCIYMRCERNSPGDIESYPMPVVFLSGQKKILDENHKKKSSKCVGVAVNTLDPLDKVFLLIEYLISANVQLILRWHPRQSINDIEKIKYKYGRNSKVELSDFEEQHVAEFLENCHTLIAGNSSIHLEASLKGIKTIYYEMIYSSIHDYYGYVKEGLSVHAKSYDDILYAILHDDICEIEKRDKSIKKYSETYNTKWCGKEGRLVADTLDCMDEGGEINALYSKKYYNDIFCEVYGID